MNGVGRIDETITLDQLAVGDSGRITNVMSDNCLLRNKLLSMGVVEGVSVSVAHVAPFGDPINIRVLGSTLSLRRSEASAVTVANK